VLDIEPNDDRIWYQQACCYRQLGNIDEIDKMINNLEESPFRRFFWD
jgi:hypothetical protein